VVTVHALDNTSWGFPSNCFVCEPGNQSGLRIPFRFDDEEQAVRAEFTLAEAFSGAPSYAHGGIVLAVLDEAMAWAAIAVTGCFAMTRTTSATFVRPVRIGRPHQVEARVVAAPGAGAEEEGWLDMAAEVQTARGRPCARASARFVRLSPRQASAAVGRGPGAR